MSEPKKFNRKRAVSDILKWRVARGNPAFWTQYRQDSLKASLEKLHDDDLLATWRQDKPRPCPRCGVLHGV